MWKALRLTGHPCNTFPFHCSRRRLSSPPFLWSAAGATGLQPPRRPIFGPIRPQGPRSPAAEVRFSSTFGPTGVGVGRECAARVRQNLRATTDLHPRGAFFTPGHSSWPCPQGTTLPAKQRRLGRPVSASGSAACALAATDLTGDLARRCPFWASAPAFPTLSRRTKPECRKRRVSASGRSLAHLGTAEFWRRPGRGPRSAEGRLAGCSRHRPGPPCACVPGRGRKVGHPCRRTWRCIGRPSRT